MQPDNHHIQHLEHPLPLPYEKGPYQHGICDPHWPQFPPGKMDNDNKDKYETFYANRVDPQKFIAILRANITAENKQQLQQVFRQLTEQFKWYAETKASVQHVLPFSLKDVPATYRVTTTLAVGSTLFADATGFDRFDINNLKPKYLKSMPSFPGDAPDFDPLQTSADILVMICSDHPYVNIAIARDIAEKFNARFNKNFGYGEYLKILNIIGIEQGFGRPDRREFLRFDDGIDNIRLHKDLERLVFVNAGDPEPAWCVNGAYMVYRKIREKLPVWEAFKTGDQEKMIGRIKKTGEPLSPHKDYPKDETPVFGGATKKGATPFDAHIRKVQPRRPGKDLFGIDDLERRFLRRPYPFFDGMDANGEFLNGLHFVAFMKSIQQQFEHVTNMWQMNPDFPLPGTGIDALYARQVLQTIDGGYYFCPPAPNGEDDYFCSALFE